VLKYARRASWPAVTVFSNLFFYLRFLLRICAVQSPRAKYKKVSFSNKLTLSIYRGYIFFVIIYLIFSIGNFFFFFFSEKLSF
jgi:hypothetical protein